MADWVAKVEESQNQDEIIRNLLITVMQLYSDEAHFIYELLQNAEDAGARNVMIKETDEELLFIHDGKPFTQEHLNAIHNVNKSAKLIDKEQSNPIGRFGVGFKSVFCISENVRFYSHPRANGLDADCEKIAGRFVNFIKPERIEDAEIPVGYTTMFVLPYTVGEPFSTFQDVPTLKRVLSERISNLGILTLLFLKNIQSIQYEIAINGEETKSGCYILDKKPMPEISDRCFLASALGSSENQESQESHYLVFSRPVDQILAGRSVDIAYELDVNDDGSFAFKKTDVKDIFVYFPTQEPSGVSFIVQGPFRTTPDRAKVRFGEAEQENKQLMAELSALFEESIKDLRNARKLNLSLLSILPFYPSSLSVTRTICEVTRRLLAGESIFPYGEREEHYVDAKHARIVYSNKDLDLFSDDYLTQLFRSKEPMHWLPTTITKDRIDRRELHGFLTQKSAYAEPLIRELEFEDLLKIVAKNPEFLKERSKEWLARFYHRCCDFSESSFEYPIVLTTSGEFVAPFIDGGQNVFPQSDFVEGPDLHYVDRDLWQECRDFFEGKLKLHAPDDFDLYVRSLEKRYANVDLITEEQFVQDFITLERYSRDGAHGRKVNALVRQYIKFRCIKENQFVYLYANQCFWPLDDVAGNIVGYFDGIADYAFVDVSFYASRDVKAEALAQYFEKIELLVHGSLADTFDYHPSGAWRSYQAKANYDYEKRQQFYYCLNLVMIDDALKAILDHPQEHSSKEKSRIIFQYLVKFEDNLTGSVYVSRGEYSGRYQEESALLRAVKGKKWLYLTNGTLAAPLGISRHSLDASIYNRLEPGKPIYQILGFQAESLDGQANVMNAVDLLLKHPEMVQDILEERPEFVSLFSVYRPGQYGESNSFEYSDSNDGTLVFKSEPVRDLESLKSHMFDMLLSSIDVRFEKRLRSIRVSRSDSEISSHLRSFYQLGHGDLCYCQVCQKQTTYPRICQISPNMSRELSPMYLLTCETCWNDYKAHWKDDTLQKSFADQIMKVSDEELEGQEPIQIQYGEMTITFAQKHIAEIRELLRLMKKAEETQ